MFREGLLLIIRRINSVCTAIGLVMRYVDWLLVGSCRQFIIEIEIKLIENSASCWFILYGRCSCLQIYKVHIFQTSGTVHKFGTCIQRG